MQVRAHFLKIVKEKIGKDNWSQSDCGLSITIVQNLVLVTNFPVTDSDQHVGSRYGSQCIYGIGCNFQGLLKDSGTRKYNKAHRTLHIKIN